MERFVCHHFKWQEGYGAFSHSKSQVQRVIQYIQEQETHHAKFSNYIMPLAVLPLFGKSHELTCLTGLPVQSTFRPYGTLEIPWPLFSAHIMPLTGLPLFGKSLLSLLYFTAIGFVQKNGLKPIPIQFLSSIL